MRLPVAKQLGFVRMSGWGGKRAGAGRPNLSKTVNHMKRPQLSLRTPLHVTLRLRGGMPNLRNQAVFKEFKKSIKESKKFGFYVIHFSIQSNHIHLFAEAKGNKSLAKGMRSLTIRFAKAFKRLNGDKVIEGPIFRGRYHLHILRTPKEVKNALEYVLLNLSKHEKFIEYMDSFSSAKIFKGWKNLLGKRFTSLIKFDAEFYKGESEYDLSNILSPAQSWLGSVGWVKAVG